MSGVPFPLSEQRPNELVENQIQQVADNDDPPDGGYGWVCVACCFAINGWTWGVVASYGVFLSYYLSHATFPDARPLDFAFIGGLNFGGAMLVAPLVTWACRHAGTRPPMAAGAFILGGGFVAASFATRIWHLYLTQGALVGIGVGFTYVPALPVLSQWFQKRRSFANGISAAGSGVGGLVYSFTEGAMLRCWTLPWALRTVGISAFVVNLLATAFIRDRNSVIRPQLRPFDKRLLQTSGVMWLLAWAFVSMLGYVTLLYSLADFAISIGLTSQQAALIIAMQNAGTAAGRPFIGVSSDRFGRFNVAAGLTLFCGICCFAIWIPANSLGVTVLLAIITGAILGVFWPTIGPLCAEIGGLKDLQSLMGLVWLVIVLPTTFSEVISLLLRRPGTEHEYLYPQCFCGACYIAASGFLLMAGYKVKKAGLE